jgi:hypothetical protein
MDGLLVRALVSEVGANVVKIKSMMQNEEDQKVLNWLAGTDYSLLHDRHIKTHQEGTGQWFLNDPKFQNWVETKGETVFCPGMPGSGKTIIAAVVIDNLGSRFSQDPSVEVAYVYFNFWQQSEQSVEALLASLLKQLTQRQPQMPDKLRKLFDQHQKKVTRPSLDEILDVLHLVISELSRVFIVVDALDECPTTNRCRAAFLTGLLELRKHGANVLATSRSIPEITEKFDLDTWLEIRARDEDVAKFVDAQILQGGSDLLKSMREEVTGATVNAASGMQVLIPSVVRLMCCLTVFLAIGSFWPD